MKIEIDKTIKVPVYQQIESGIANAIDDGALSLNEQIPSINQIANDNGIARETVVKAFKLLQQRGIIKSVHGKGFFVATDNSHTKHRVFLLLDALTPYKQKLYNAVVKSFGDEAFVDVYFHHYNEQQFTKLIEEANGNYTSYIIIPFLNPKVSESIKSLPLEKVVIVDQKPDCVDIDCSGVYQDFDNDVYAVLDEIKDRIAAYNQLTLIFRNDVTIVPDEIRMGFERYCIKQAVNFKVVTEFENYKPQIGEAFLVIDDEDLVYLVEQCMEQDLRLGKDIGILSYNETSFKRVIAGGISVISTDWELMGTTTVGMIVNNNYTLLANPCKLINRNSF